MNLASVLTLVGIAGLLGGCSDAPAIQCADRANCDALLSAYGLDATDVHAMRSIHVDVSGYSVELFSVDLLPGYDCENGCGYDHFLAIREPADSGPFLLLNYAFTWSAPTPELASVLVDCAGRLQSNPVDCDLPSWHLAPVQNGLLAWAQLHPDALAAPLILHLHNFGIIP